VDNIAAVSPHSKARTSRRTAFSLHQSGYTSGVYIWPGVYLGWPGYRCGGTRVSSFPAGGRQVFKGLSASNNRAWL